MVKRQFNVHVRRIRSDNGTKFTNSSFQRYLREEGIIHETSCVATPQQNRHVERKHRHIINVARALRFEANLPMHFWGECVLAATHLIDRTPTIANNGITLYEMLYGKPPRYEHLRIFGCLCYVKNSLRQYDKFAPRAERCIFVGYPQGQRGWKVYNLETREFFVSHDVIFYETVFPYSTHTRDMVTTLSAPMFHDTAQGDTASSSDTLGSEVEPTK